MFEPLFLVLLSAIALVGAWTDLRQRRIPNWLCAANLFAGLTYVGMATGWSDLGMAALHVLVALVVVIGLNAIGAIGAGDAKFYASFAAWLPIERGLWLLVSVALAGLVLLIAFVIWRLGTGARLKRQAGDDFGKLPYGMAISAGGLIAIAMA